MSHQTFLRGGGGEGRHGEDEEDDPADELINLFRKVQTHDHEELVEQFSRIMNADMGVARFFLESSNWSVETAVHTFLASGVGGDERDVLVRPGTVPSFKLLTDLTPLNETSFAPNTVIDMYWNLLNDGQEPWPHNTRVVHMDGERLGGFSSVPVRAEPGESIRVRQRLITPNRTGSFAGRWSLCCPAGYFGEPIWVIVTVASPLHNDDVVGGRESRLIEMHGGDATMMEESLGAFPPGEGNNLNWHQDNGATTTAARHDPFTHHPILGADGHMIPGGVESSSSFASSSSDRSQSNTDNDHQNGGGSMEFN